MGWQALGRLSFPKAETHPYPTPGAQGSEKQQENQWPKLAVIFRFLIPPARCTLLATFHFAKKGHTNDNNISNNHHHPPLQSSFPKRNDIFLNAYGKTARTISNYKTVFTLNVALLKTHYFTPFFLPHTGTNSCWPSLGSQGRASGKGQDQWPCTLLLNYFLF